MVANPFRIDFALIRGEIRLFRKLAEKTLLQEMILSFFAPHSLQSNPSSLSSLGAVFERLFQPCADALCQFAEGADPLFQKPVHG
jgi:hypothetical protein